MEESAEKDIHFLDYWRVIRGRREIILAVTLLVVVTAAAYTFTRSKIYMASARIEVSDDNMDVAVFGRIAPSRYDPHFLRTQYEIIKSRSILNQVIENLNLQRRWSDIYLKEGGELSQKDCYDILYNLIHVKPFRDTTLLEIQANNEDPEHAAELASAVALAYRDRRLTSKTNMIQRSIDVLKNELKKQQEIVNDAETSLETLREELDISILGVGGGMYTDTLKLQGLESSRISAEIDMTVRESRLKEVLKLSDEDLTTALNFIIPDPTLAAVRNTLIDTEVSLRLALESYGPSHPDVKRLQAGVDELRNRMQEAISGLKKGMDADYQIARAKYNKLNEILGELRAQDIKDQKVRLLPFQRELRNVSMQREILGALRARVAQEGIEVSIPRTPVDIIEQAVAPGAGEQVSPKYVLNIVMSIVVGLGLGIGMAYFIEYLDTSVKTLDDVEKYLGLPVIGIIPQKVRPLSEEGPDGPHAEAYRLLRTNMQFANKGTVGGAYGVVSGGVGEGKSTTLFNLAYVCAQLGDKVLVVDSDLRRPVQHTFLNMSNRFGLTNLLMRDVSIEETIKPTTVPNLHFLPSGQLPKAALGLLDSQRMRDLVKNLKARYDYVFFDAPPLMGVSDASILASEVDAVLLVVQYRKYPRTMSARAKRVIDNVGGKIVGVVLNNINIMRDDYYYYYHSHYSHYYGSSNAEDDGDSGGVSAEDLAQPAEQKEEVF
jgi:succinoglycan biosynthesis transport protein ExoP